MKTRGVLALLAAASLVGCATAHSPLSNQATDDAYPSAAFLATDAPATAPAERPALAPKESLGTAIRDVTAAPDIDAAVEAYSHGLTIDKDNAALHRAFVRRTVDLGVPQLGTAAAERLVSLQPDDPLARAVLAFSEARLGQMDLALTNISLAVKRAPEDPFIQRTAGHLLAWYDNHPGLEAPDALRASIAQTRARMQTALTYIDAYRDADNFYHDQRERFARGPTTGPSTAPSTQPLATTHNAEPPPDLADNGGYGGGGIGYVPSTPGPYATPAYDGYPYEPYAYEPYYWGSVFGFGFVDVFAFDRRHHFDHDHDRSHDHDADDHSHERTYERSNSQGNRGGVGSLSAHTGSVYTPTAPLPHIHTPIAPSPHAGHTGSAYSGHPGADLSSDGSTSSSAAHISTSNAPAPPSSSSTGAPHTGGAFYGGAAHAGGGGTHR